MLSNLALKTSFKSFNLKHCSQAFLKDLQRLKNKNKIKSMTYSLSWGKWANTSHYPQQTHKPTPVLSWPGRPMGNGRADELETFLLVAVDCDDDVISHYRKDFSAESHEPGQLLPFGCSEPED